MYGEGSKEKSCDSQCSTSNKANESEKHSPIQNATCLMALDEQEVTSNSNDLNSYTFDELQDAFDELALDFEKMNLRYKKIVSKLNIENEFLMKTKIDLEKQNEEMKKNFEVCQMKSDALENENVNLKMKLEELLKEKKRFK
ncbi:hypothetical protein PTKIN_Ptkin11bG0075300 [Pterospermum kingtungense]